MIDTTTDPLDLLPPTGAAMTAWFANRRGAVRYAHKLAAQHGWPWQPMAEVTVYHWGSPDTTSLVVHLHDALAVVDALARAQRTLAPPDGADWVVVAHAVNAHCPECNRDGRHLSRDPLASHGAGTSWGMHLSQPVTT